MMNNLLSMIVVSALIGVFLVAPGSQPASLAVAPRAAPPEPAVVLRPVVASNDLQAHQPPIPLMRGVRPPVTARSPDLPSNKAEGPSLDDMDRGAAKAAIEADGYKGVSVLDKGMNGTWRAKAYRGTTEIKVTVDSAGRVSAD
jgi:hypothetical protein